jgi:nucleoside-diphosphate-sugar epimerase
MKNQKKYLIIGGDGVLGNAFRAISVESTSIFVFTSRLTTELKHDTVPLDLLSDFTKFDFSSFTAVIYLAQSREYKNLPLGMSDLCRINVIAPGIIAQTLNSLGVKFVYCSSGSVYKSSKLPISETDELKSNSCWDAYSASKLLAESAILGINPNNLVLRPFFIFGQSWKNGSLIPSLLTRLKNDSEITLAGHEGLVFNPIFSHDAARAILHLLEFEGDGIYNLSGAESVSLKKLVDNLAQFFDITPRYKISNSQEILLGDNSRLVDTGFHYLRNLDESLKLYFSELKLTEH